MSDKVKNRQNKNLGNVRTAPSLASWAVTIGLLGVAVGAVMPILEHGFGSHLYAYIYMVRARCSRLSGGYSCAPRTAASCSGGFTASRYGVLSFSVPLLYSCICVPPRAIGSL